MFAWDVFRWVCGDQCSRGQNFSMIKYSTMYITNESISNLKNDLSFDLQSKNTDELYSKAVSIVIDQQKVSTSFIQRYLQIGYNRAARIIEQMEEEGIISEASHAGKRSVLKK